MLRMHECFEWAWRAWRQRWCLVSSDDNDSCTGMPMMTGHSQLIRKLMTSLPYKGSQKWKPKTVRITQLAVQLPETFLCHQGLVSQKYFVFSFVRAGPRTNYLCSTSCTAHDIGGKYVAKAESLSKCSLTMMQGWEDTHFCEPSARSLDTFIVHRSPKKNISRSTASKEEERPPAP